MGSRGSFSGGGGSASEWFNERYFEEIGHIENIKILRQTNQSISNKEPVYAGSNDKYIVLDKSEDVPKNICFYKDHKLKVSIDFDYKGNTVNIHQHVWESKPDTNGGNDIVFRKRHDKDNVLPVSKARIGLVRKLIKKYRLDERYRITIESS